MIHTSARYAIDEHSTTKHLLPGDEDNSCVVTLCGEDYCYVVQSGIVIDHDLCRKCDAAANTTRFSTYSASEGRDIVRLGTLSPTLKGIRDLLATRPSQDSTHTEALVHAGSYRQMPLPGDGGEYSLSMSGTYRYLFHDGEDLIEIEYANSRGVLRETYLRGTRIARTYTPIERYAR